MLTAAKASRGSLVVYANALTRTERDEQTGDDVEREIPYWKGYAVFNVEQDRRSARSLLRQGRTEARSRGSHRPYRELLRRLEGHHPTWRQSYIFCAGNRLRSDAAVQTAGRVE